MELPIFSFVFTIALLGIIVICMKLIIFELYPVINTK